MGVKRGKGGPGAPRTRPKETPCGAEGSPADRAARGPAAALRPAWSWPGLQALLEPQLTGIAEMCGEESPVTVVHVHLWHEDIGELRGVAGLVDESAGQPTFSHLWCRVLVDENLPVTEALRRQRVVTVEDPAGGAARYPRRERQTWGDLAGACVCVPVTVPAAEDGSGDDAAPVAEEKPLGVLTVAFRDPMPLGPELVERLGGCAARIGERIAAVAELPRAEPFRREPTASLTAAVAASRDAAGVLGEDAGATAARSAPRPGRRTRRSRTAARLRATLAALDAAGTGTFDWDLETGRIALDARLSRLLGKDIPYVGPIEPVLCLLHPADYPVFRMHLAEAFATGGPFSSGQRVLGADAVYRWVEMRGSVVPSGGGGTHRMRGVVTDVTEASDLRVNLARQVEDVEAMVVAVDEEWRVVYCNAAGAQMFGRPRAEILGRALHALLPEAYSESWGRELFTALQERRPQTVTLHMPGDDRWFQVRVHPWRGQMVLYCVDITDEYRDAARQREAAQVTAARQARVQLLTAALAESLTVDDVVRAARRLPAVCGADGLVIGMVQGGRLRVIGHVGYSPQTAGEHPAWDLGENAPFVEVVRRRSAFAITSRAEYVRRYPHLHELAGASGRHAWVFLPLVASGEVVGSAVLSYNRERDFGPDDFRFLGQMRALLARALHRARRYDDEHAMSSGLQRGLLPGRPTRIPGLTIATRYLPATVGMQVGGDWHDVIALPEGRAGLVIGDVQGHGVDAAAIMGILRTAVLAYAVEGHEPGEVVRRTNALTAGLGTDLFATCAYAEFDPSSGRALVVRAGHQHPVLVERAGVRQVDVPGGLPLGIDTGARYPVTELVLRRGDVLVLCTDGLVESRGLSLDEGVAWMLATLEDGRGMSPDGLAGHLIARRTGELGDDIALLLARYDGSDG
ncbi:SpoIIE family protein phosphatase [Yinghuangia sp. ASG 101]|uniref:SpoIIE family protein phosphatase n=1 Tax=Yinghuangia sp. ASG 101 TaxID=2896848 RepID=UPI001E4DC5D6|nr:SpoIIE family protein phosphatase [Yinghuangia sp. ASG 101]UGQ08988.1 SpoIIE family protein phosphatase [Yinghuangia sp. ASG 101]